MAPRRSGIVLISENHFEIRIIGFTLSFKNYEIEFPSSSAITVRVGEYTLESFKPGFHIVVSVVSVVRKKFIGQLQFYGNLPYKCSIQKKRQIQLFVRDRMNSICPMNFFRKTDTTDTTIWKPGLKTRTKTSTSLFYSPHPFEEN